MKKTGRFGLYGGRYIPETLIPAVEELECAYQTFRGKTKFRNRLNYLLKEYAGRPTPLYLAENLSKKYSIDIYLKREDLLHGGAHKINNTLGQVLLAKLMGKKRVIAETGAGQHGVATAIAAASMGLECEVYMGSVDIERQKLNVFRMELMGAKVIPVNSGTKTLKDATNQALREWLSRVYDTYYCIGSVVGPHPYPTIVRDLQSVIGKEIKSDFMKKTGRLPDAVVACVGGGSNAIGSFSAFIQHKNVKLIGVEAAGLGTNTKKHCATLSKGRDGVLHGMRSKLLQDRYGQILETHSISAGLDYPGVGPELSHLKEIKRLHTYSASDDEAVSAVQQMCAIEGILPALESAHAMAYVIKHARRHRGEKMVVTVSGRGDKDVKTISDYLGVKI
jgi:tryptophan synthase beta chain